MTIAGDVVSQSGEIGVVGGGLHGLLLAWALRRSGLSVVVYERDRVGAPQAGVRATTRLFDPEDDVVAEGWRDLWRDLGVRLAYQPGLVALRRTDTGDLGSTHPGELLAEGDLAGLAPGLDTAGIVEARRFPLGGVLFPRRILASLRGWLQRQGVDIREGVGVTSLGARHVTVGGDTIAHAAVAVATGRWLPELVPPIRKVCRFHAHARLDLHPAADALRLWVRAPVLMHLDVDHTPCVLPHEGGSDLAVEWRQPLASVPGDSPGTLAVDPGIVPVAAALASLRWSNRYGLRKLHLSWALRGDLPPEVDGVHLFAGGAFERAPLDALSVADSLARHVQS